MVTTACDVMQQFLSISAVDNDLLCINELKVTNSTQYCSKQGRNLRGGMGGGGVTQPPSSRFRRAQGKFAGQKCQI